MEKTVFIFPGQGSQHPGMGKDLYDNHQIAKDIFEKASDVLGFSMEKLCFESSEEELKKTENTQPALLTVSTAAFKVLEQNNIQPSACAGHSLGEYSALVAAGITSFEDTLKLVRKRGELMANADPDGKGGMAAVIGLEPDQLETLLEKGSKNGIIEAANYNCPGQIVLSGDKKSILEAEKIADELGAMRYVVLEVSGPFHSTLMKPAGEKFKEELEQVRFSKGSCNVVSNVTAKWSDLTEIADLLSRQIYSPVKWEESINFLKDEGFLNYIEVGSGKVLRGLMRRIDRKLTTSGTDNIQKIIENFS